AGGDPRVEIRFDLRRIEHGLLVQTPIVHAPLHRFFLCWIAPTWIENWSLIEDLNLLLGFQLQPLETRGRDARISEHMNLLPIEMTIFLRLGYRLEMVGQLPRKNFTPKG